MSSQVKNSNGFLDSLSRDHLHAKVQAVTWVEAVKLAGHILVKTGSTKPAYTQAMIDGLEELGPYSVIAPGVALPHARPENGVIKMGFSLVTLLDPVEFGSKENDPVDIVIGFAAIDKNSHIQMLKDIASMVGHDEFLYSIRNAASRNELFSLIQSERKKL